jgi:hypothetical protein
VEIRDITPEFIERVLWAVRYGNPIPDTVLQLDFICRAANDEQARKESFYHFLADYVSERLTYYRRLFSVPTRAITGEADFRAAVAADFAPEQPTLEAWSAVYYRYFEPDLQFEVNELAEIAGVNRRRLDRRAERAIRELTAVVRKEEGRAHELDRAAFLRAGLGAPEYQTLYGVDSLRAEVVRLLRQPDGPRFISLEGIGGIGKTALAHATANALISADLDGILWVSARQEKFNPYRGIEADADAARSLNEVVSQLMSRLGLEEFGQLSLSDKLSRLVPILSQRSYLVIIDNLETVAESQLLPSTLYPLAGATRFLITSRESLRAFDFVAARTVPELSDADSRLLVRGELARIGSSVTPSEADLNRIIEAVGGVPLALKLVAAQIAVMPVEDCLAGLRKAEGQSIEALFTFIYRATWRLLTAEARRLLLGAGSVILPEGARPLWLQKMGEGVGLSQPQYTAALEELRRYSLMDAFQAEDGLRYRIHRLTLTFLQTEFLKDDPAS